MRVNVYVPDELMRSLQRARPGLNISAAVQSLFRDLISCGHEHGAVCSDCAAPIDLHELTQRSRRDLAWAVWLRLTDHVVAGGTPEGAARVVLDELGRHQVPDVDTWVLPRLSRSARAEREAARERHPTGRRPVVGGAVGLQEVSGL